MQDHFQKSIKFAAGLIVAGIFLFCLYNLIIFFTAPIRAQVSSDAIAIRVIPNPEHYSALRWYKKQEFSGSPQSLIIDGYEAVRDGRTVYVNAANIAGETLYTNIYLIVYNQEAIETTQDIFSQILSHWKFNTNVSDFGQCNQTNSVICGIDSDCPLSEYCLSDKAKIINDTGRLADLVEISELLERYKTENNRYPAIKAGSYLPNKTISVWPSWQSVLAQELKTVLPADPINKLGNCGDSRFNPITCWDEKSKEFADADSNDAAINLPSGSSAYVYSAEANGKGYDICAVMQSGYVAGVGSGACAAAETIEINKSGVNSPPVFVSQNLISYQGLEYKGFVLANDADGDTISWAIDALATDWSSWSAAPVPQSQSTPNQVLVYALKAGNMGVYPIRIEITDGIDVVSKIFDIQIINTTPSVTTKNSTVVVGHALAPMIFTATDNENHAITMNIGIALPAGLTGAQTGNTYAINGIPNGITPLTYTHVNQIIATDEYGAVVSRNFNITITNNRPIVNLSKCETTFRTSNYYECQTIANDQDEHNLIFSMTSGPFSLAINPNTGLISGTLGNAEEGIYNLNIVATDEYGAISLTGILNLNVVNFCGDGELQNPNIELRGGSADDGREQCDGAAGLAINPADSNSNKKYACTTTIPPAGTECLTTGSCAGTCAYISGKLGGYCGDEIVQNGSNGTVNYGEYCDDGNRNNGDGCDSACRIENNWSCFGTPSVCYLCGNGIIDPGEACDASGNCVVTFTNDLPPHCSGIPVDGTRTCKNDCSGWNECVALPPATINNSSTACSTTNPSLTDYACCELLDCAQDGCNCCGTGEAEINIGYQNVQSKDAVWNFSQSVGFCGMNGNAPTNACRLNISITNQRNWQITTNHSTAYYRCWE